MCVHLYLFSVTPQVGFLASYNCPWTQTVHTLYFSLVYLLSRLDPYIQQQYGCDPSEIRWGYHIVACFLIPWRMNEQHKQEHVSSSTERTWIYHSSNKCSFSQCHFFYRGNISVSTDERNVEKMISYTVEFFLWSFFSMELLLLDQLLRGF